MKVKEDTYDVGIVIGRFQVPELHDAHRELLRYVCKEHDKVILFLGKSPLRGTIENPLDFEARRQMIQEEEEFKHVNVLFIDDAHDDHVWSARLDRLIEGLVTPNQTAVLYGGRDSFVARYHGRYPTQELESSRYLSGSEVRKKVGSRSTRPSADFRAGVVWASSNRFPTVYTTVDVGVFNEDGSKLLLGRKPDEIRWRLLGGFLDATRDTSYESAARREVQEESGIAITDPQYVGSFEIADWRYRGEVDRIITALFRAKRLSGGPRAGDDIAEVGWFDTTTLSDNDVVPNHRQLIHALVPEHSQR